LYFCRFESRNFKNKIISSLELDNGEKIYDQSKILSETKIFYENLYKNRINNVDLENDF
jgi:hypothetical protein